MNKPLLFACALAFPVTAFISIACDGSNIVPCETDDDCKDNADAPVCDTDLGQCGAKPDPECKEDQDCSLADKDSATSADDCSANSDCGTAEHCVKDSLDATYCVTEAADQAECDASSSGTLTTLTDEDGGDFSGCLQDGTCTDEKCE